MPQLAPFIAGALGAAAPAIGTAAFGAYVAGAGFASFMTTTIVGKLLTSVAISALTIALQDKPGLPPQQGIRTEYTMTGGANPASFVLGRYATEGQLVAPPMSHGQDGGVPNAYLTYVIDLGDIPGQTLEGLFIDGEPVTLGATAHADYGLPVEGRHQDYAWVKYYDGTQTAADPMLLDKYGSDPDRPWTADMIGTGICYAICTFRRKRDLYSAFPKVRFVMGGIPLYDPRKDTTVGGSGSHRWANPSTWESSTNPAVQVYNIARGITLPSGDVWGGNATTDDLPLSSWFAAMNASDAQVEAEAGVFEPAWRAGFEVFVSDEPASVIEELLKAASGQVSEVGGVWKIRIGSPGLPVFFFSDDDINISESQNFEPFPGIGQTYNGVHATYPDPDALWNSTDAPPRYNATYEAADGDRRLVADLALPSVPYANQVQRLMAAYIEEERRMRRHSLTLAPSAIPLEPLDSVSWTSARNGYDAKVFEISAMVDPLVRSRPQVALRERDPDDYDWQPNQKLPTTLPSLAVGVPAPYVVQSWAFTAITLKDAGNADRRPALRLTWAGQDDDEVEGVAYEVRLQASGAAVADGVVLTGASGQVVVSAGILPQTQYEARLRLVPSGRRRSSWTSWASATTGDVRLAESDIPESVNQAVVDFNAVAAGFEGTLVDLQVDAEAAQQAGLEAAQAALDAAASALDSDAARTAAQLARDQAQVSAQDSAAARLASQTARDAAQNARDNAQTAATSAGNSATVAAGSASSAQTSATAAGSSASLSEGQALIATTSAAEAARTAALAGPSILALPAAQWTRQSAGFAANILKPAAAELDFVAGDAEFGEAFEFPDGSNTTIGQAWPYDWTDTAVYSVRVRFKVVSDGTVVPDAGGAPGVQYRIGGTVQAGTSVLAANVQDGGQVARVSDGVIEREVWFTRRAVGDMPSLPSGLLLVTFSATADGGNRFYPHLRQNYTAGVTTNGVLRVGDIEIRNITALVDGMLAEEAAFGSATASASSAAAASASETAAGTSASAAETSRVDAETARASAQASANSAATSETNAAGSASSAADARNVAVSARDDAAQEALAAAGYAIAASASETAAGLSASASESSSVTAQARAALTFPADFREEGAYFTRSSTGLEPSPISASQVVPAPGVGPVFQQSGFAVIAPRGYLPAVPGRVYEFEAILRVTSNNTVSGADERGILSVVLMTETGALHGYGSPVARSGDQTVKDPLRAADGWQTLRGIYTIPETTAYAFLRPRAYYGFTSGGTNANGTWQCRSFSVREVTSEIAAGGFASAAATSASAAEASSTEAGQFATAAETSKVNADTARAQAQASATSAATSATNAAGSASTATTQANLAATARNSAQAYAADASNSATDAATAKSGADSASATAVSARDLAVAANLAAENLAVQLLPSDFQEDGRYFTSNVAGAPGASPLLQDWYFVDVAGEGRVARVSAASGAQWLMTAGLIKPVAGRTYRITVRCDLGGTVSGTPDISLFFRELDASYAYVAAHGFTSFDVTYNFANYSIEFTPATDMAYLRPGFYKRTEMAGTGFFQCSALLVEDVTESKAALASATSASASASSAASARDTAVSSASTATTQANLAAAAKNDAVTARSGAEIAETSAVNAKVAAETAKNAAETARSGAEFARNVAASISGGGDVENPLFIEPSSNPTAAPTGFSLVGGFGSSIARVATGNKYGNGPCIEYTTGSTLSSSRPYIIINHTALGGLAASDVEAVEVDFEVEMISGTWGSAHIFVNWEGANYRGQKVYLKDAITSRNGKVQRVTAVLERPADYVAGTTDDLRVIFYGNANGDANGETNHNARIHRFDYQVLSTYAASLLNQRAVADLEGNALASFVMRAKAGAAAGSVEIVAATDAANSGASASKVTLTADEIELAGDATIFSGNEIKSSNFVSGVSGWRIRNNGTAEFNKLIARSDIVNGAVNDDLLANLAVGTAKVQNNAISRFYSAVGGSSNKQIAITNNTGVTVDLLIMAFIKGEATGTQPTINVRLYKETVSGGLSNEIGRMEEIGPDTTPSSNTIKLTGTVIATTTQNDGITRYYRAVGTNCSQIDLIVFQRQK